MFFVGHLRMLMHNQPIAPASLVVGLVSVDVCCDATDDFKSTLIDGYELAIKDGLSPNECSCIGPIDPARECLDDRRGATEQKTQERSMPHRDFKGPAQ